MNIFQKVMDFLATDATSNGTEHSGNSFRLTQGLDKIYEEETITHGALSGEKTISYKIMMGDYGNPFDNE